MKSFVWKSGLTLVVLVGCGGSSDEEATPDTVGPVSFFSGDPNVTVNYDEATDTFYFNDPNRVIGFEDEEEGFRYYRYQFKTKSGRTDAIVANLASGNGSVGAVDSNEFEGGFWYSRDSETQVPTGGTANYSGDYGGILGFARIYGDVSLAANFDSGSISGVISNRQRIYSSSETYEDITLAPTSIADGAFNGVATGGEGDGSRITTTTPGTYSGLLAGPNGEEIVGGLKIIHDSSGSMTTETGAFVATQ